MPAKFRLTKLNHYYHKIVCNNGRLFDPESDETLGWKEIVDDGVEVVFVPGDHESIFHSPHVEFFSKRLCQMLQLAE
jgi:hypothetical protein